MTQTLEARRRRLEEARSRLHQEITAELEESGDHRAAEAADRVRDAGEASVTDLLADLEYSTIERHLAELRGLERAVERIDLGSYGYCVDCGQPIAEGRLDAHPAAERCIDCQSLLERTTESGGQPSL